MIENTELENGAKLIYENIEHTNICSIGFWFKTGSVHENLNQKGYAHFIEHILFKGTKTKTTSEIAILFDKIGSSFNAFTEKEITCFHCTFPAKHLEYVIKLYTEIIFFPLFDKDEIEKEKNVIISEIMEYEEIPEENSYDIFMNKMWHPNSLGCKITGEISDVKKIKRDSIYEYYLDQYSPQNLLLSVAGAFDENILISLLNKSIPASKTVKQEIKLEKQEPKYSYDFLKNSSKQIHIYTGISFPSPKEITAYYTFLFFSTIVGESMSSRLFQKLREEKGFCYSVYSFRSIFENYSMWNIYAATKPDIAVTFMENLSCQLKLIGKHFFSEQEFDDAKRHLEGSLILSQEDVEVRMKRLARHYIFNGKCFNFAELSQILDNITIDNLNIFIKENLSDKNFNTFIYGNIKQKDFPKNPISIS